MLYCYLSINPGFSFSGFERQKFVEVQFHTLNASGCQSIVSQQ